MHKAHRCKHCGRGEGKHAAFTQECLRAGHVIKAGQKFEADPERFTVYPNAPKPRTVQQTFDSVFRSLENACR